jgi:hypothetical protein
MEKSAPQNVGYVSNLKNVPNKLSPSHPPCSSDEKLLTGFRVQPERPTKSMGYFFKFQKFDQRKQLLNLATVHKI